MSKAATSSSSFGWLAAIFPVARSWRQNWWVYRSISSWWKAFTAEAAAASDLIPIISPVLMDPVQRGLASSLARPGRNITGFTLMHTELNSKRLELLHTALPQITTVSALMDPANAASKLAFEQTETAARLRDYADDGGLTAYGANVADNFRRAASDVDRILKGAKPGDLPIQEPAGFDFVVNLKTANALGLTIPPLILGRADEVIE